MLFPVNKTKLVCTIGPASDRPKVLQEMLRAGMNVARLNISHGDFDSHARVIADLRAAADKVGRRLAIMADLPGPKIRIGELSSESVELTTGDTVVLTTEEIAGDARRQPPRQAGDNGDPDARVDDRTPPADARRGHRCRQCDPR